MHPTIYCLKKSVTFKNYVLTSNKNTTCMRKIKQKQTQNKKNVPGNVMRKRRE